MSQTENGSGDIKKIISDNQNFKGTSTSILDYKSNTLLGESIDKIKSPISKNILNTRTGESKIDIGSRKRSYKTNYFREGHSNDYIQLKTRELIQFLIQELQIWSSVDKADALVNIHSIKEALDKNFGLLSQIPEYRLFISTLMLMTNNWKTLEQEQIKSISEHLQVYKDGILYKDSISSLQNFLYSQGLSPFTSHE